MEFSLIICTYQRPEELKRVLDQLCQQLEKFSLDIEIIVANNNSSYPTGTLIEAFSAVDQRIKPIFVSSQGKSYALNAGIKAAKSDWLIFTDDDIVLSDDWLMGVAKFIRQNKADCFVGRILPRWDNPVPDWYDERMGSVLVKFDHGPTSERPIQYLVGANMGIKRQVFEQYGYFNETLPRFEDSELSLRLTGKVKMTYVPDILIYHPVYPYRVSQEYFRRWYFDVGRLIDPYIVESEKYKICGIPRWVYREYAWHWMNRLMAKKANDRFFHELQLSRLKGLFKSRWAINHTTHLL